MTTIKLIPPKGYDTIKPLHDSTGRPVRCAPTPTPDPAPARSYCTDCPAFDCDHATDRQQEAHL